MISGVEGAKPLQRCYYCSQPALHACSACKIARYCSKNCQTKDWKAFHKKLCGKQGLLEKECRDILSPSLLSLLAGFKQGTFEICKVPDNKAVDLELNPGPIYSIKPAMNDIEGFGTITLMFINSIDEMTIIPYMVIPDIIQAAQIFKNQEWSMMLIPMKKEFVVINYKDGKLDDSKDTYSYEIKD